MSKGNSASCRAAIPMPRSAGTTHDIILPRPLRVLLVEDSRVMREYLTHIISTNPRLKIVAAVESGESALRVLREANPDVISMDVRLPGLDGLETTRRIMAERPTPIIVVAGNVESDDLKISFNALRAGALAVLEKPRGHIAKYYDSFAEKFCTQLVIMSQVKVIKRRLHDLPARTRRPAHSAAAGAAQSAAYAMIGLVASTGGPNALAEILGALKQEMAAPIVIVQHITPCFSKAFTEWLGDVCELNVLEAGDGVCPAPGKVYVAPANRHLIAQNGRLWLSNEAPICQHRPSGDALFESLAREFGPRAIGVLLTGMGEDGARGLRAMRDAGAHTIVEHESTAVVNGMPGAALTIAAACEALPLPEIAPRLRELMRRKHARG